MGEASDSISGRCSIPPGLPPTADARATRHGRRSGSRSSPRGSRAAAQSPAIAASGTRLRPSSRVTMDVNQPLRRRRPYWRRKSSGAPITQATSASSSAAERECWKKNGCSGGRDLAWSCSGRSAGGRSRRTPGCSAAPSHQTPLPATTAGRSAEFSRSAAFTVLARVAERPRRRRRRQRRRMRLSLLEEDVSG